MFFNVKISLIFHFEDNNGANYHYSLTYACKRHNNVGSAFQKLCYKFFIMNRTLIKVYF